MDTNASNAVLEQVPTYLIQRNPENPRLLFRPEELDELLESIRRYGIQVPLSVYKLGKHFILIDGERRWTCAQRLGMSNVPALVQSKPDALTNLLLMFNIHALREQWDLLTIALKLPRVKDLLEKQLGHAPTERELALETGLSRGVIRRCKLLIALPQEFKDDILKELNKPKPQQKITEDLFIEMERALKTVERAMPDFIDRKNRIRRVLVDKYKKGVITSRIQFRQVAKIARARNVAADQSRAEKVLGRLFDDNDYSIEQAYSDSVSQAYTERDILTKIQGLAEKLSGLRQTTIDTEVRDSLTKLSVIIDRLLRGRK
jgi:ParB family transcriptional regulator, chromosome partitioning protein